MDIYNTPYKLTTRSETLLHNILYRIEISILYHRKRERFLDCWDRAGKVLVVLAVAVSLVRPSLWAAPLVVPALCSLVFSWSARASKHAHLAQQFLALHADAVGEYDPDEAMIANWDAQIRRIEIQEPSPLNVFVEESQNQLAIACDQVHKYVPIAFWRWALAIFGIDTAVPPTSQVKDNPKTFTNRAG
jgi:hypothetical protein